MNAQQHSDVRELMEEELSSSPAECLWMRPCRSWARPCTSGRLLMLGSAALIGPASGTETPGGRGPTRPRGKDPGDLTSRGPPALGW